MSSCWPSTMKEATPTKKGHHDCNRKGKGKRSSDSVSTQPEDSDQDLDHFISAKKVKSAEKVKGYSSFSEANSAELRKEKKKAGKKKRSLSDSDNKVTPADPTSDLDATPHQSEAVDATAAGSTTRKDCTSNSDSLQDSAPVSKTKNKKEQKEENVSGENSDWENLKSKSDHAMDMEEGVKRRRKKKKGRHAAEDFQVPEFADLDHEEAASSDMMVDSGAGLAQISELLAETETSETESSAQHSGRTQRKDRLAGSPGKKNRKERNSPRRQATDMESSGAQGTPGSTSASTSSWSVSGWGQAFGSDEVAGSHSNAVEDKIQENNSDTSPPKKKKKKKKKLGRERSNSESNVALVEPSSGAQGSSLNTVTDPLTPEGGPQAAAAEKKKKKRLKSKKVSASPSKSSKADAVVGQSHGKVYKSVEFIENDDSSSSSDERPNHSVSEANSVSQPSGSAEENSAATASVCYICDQDMPSTEVYIAHLAQAHGKLSYLCCKCRKPLSSEEQLKCHMKVSCRFKDCEDKVAPFHCHLCPTSYSQEKGLQRHKRLEHGIGRPVHATCQHCGREFTTSFRAKMHMAKCAEGLLEQMKPRHEDVECDHCGKLFSSPQSLCYHVRTLHMKHVFVCVCRKKFRGSSLYYKHAKVCEKVTQCIGTGDPKI